MANNGNHDLKEWPAPFPIGKIGPLRRLWENPVFQARMHELSNFGPLPYDMSVFDAIGFFVVGLIIEIVVVVIWYLSYEPDVEFPAGMVLAAIVAFPAWLGYIPIAWSQKLGWTLNAAKQVSDSFRGERQIFHDGVEMRDTEILSGIVYGEIYYGFVMLGPALGWLAGCYIGCVVPSLFIYTFLSEAAYQLHALGGVALFTAIFAELYIIMVVPIFMLAPIAGIVGTLFPAWFRWILLPIQWYMSWLLYPSFIYSEIIAATNSTSLYTVPMTPAAELAVTGAMWCALILLSYVIITLLGWFLYRIRWESAS